MLLSGCFVAASPAAAQLTVYGLVDLGVTHLSNEGGSSVNKLSSGDLQLSRLGFRGTEDLGGGYKASFALEHRFDASTGASVSPSTFWSGESNLSLAMPIGTLTLGSQGPSYVDALFKYNATMLTYGPGYYATHPGNYDRALNSLAPNSAKYTTPSLGGFKFGATYQFSEGTTSGLRSFGASYDNGPLSLGAGYVNAKSVSLSANFLAPAANPFTAAHVDDESESVGVGVGYALGTSYVHALFTQSKFEKEDRKASTWEVGMKWVPGTTWTFGVDFSQTSVPRSDARMRALVLSASYPLSKRTDIYGILANEKVSGNNINGTPLVAQFFLHGASSTNSQNALRLAIRHRF